MFDEFFTKANELRKTDTPFVMAFVVRFDRPISGKPGNKAIITQDGELIGWIGGGCTKDIIIREALVSIRDGLPRLIRISPDDEPEIKTGIMRYNMTCHSGGSVDVYLDPVIPKPHIVVLGKSPIALALVRISQAMKYKVTLMADTDLSTELNVDARYSDYNESALSELPNAYVVVATQGEGDEEALAAALRSDHQYVAFVASHKKANAVFMYLKDNGVGFDQLGKVKSPAGLDIKARSAEEIALSILAEIVSIRRDIQNSEVAEATPEVSKGVAIDPICQMQVKIDGAKHISEFDGMKFYFCCAGCKSAFEQEPEKYH